jgi:hypothetical protein
VSAQADTRQNARQARFQSPGLTRKPKIKIFDMPKSLLFNLFGWGKMPAALKAEIEREGLVLFDEGVAGSQTMRNFHRHKQLVAKAVFVGSVAISQRRCWL